MHVNAITATFFWYCEINEELNLVNRKDALSFFFEIMYAVVVRFLRMKKNPWMEDLGGFSSSTFSGINITEIKWCCSQKKYLVIDFMNSD